ncbi:MAG: T9SS C-terminal target domain-containing protein [Calditrichaeota bacterium]|nr:MAG: T9SS C-terminal target domain-containing protein [Calditrichota bacterium]
MKVRLLHIVMLVLTFAFASILFSQEVVIDHKVFKSKSLNINVPVSVHRPASVTPETPCPVLIWLSTNIVTPADYDGFKNGLQKQLTNGKASPMLVVIASALTGNPNLRYYGIHLYCNSEYYGKWGDFVVKDLIEWVGQNYSVPKTADGGHDRRYWLIAGFDMGGSGAVRLAYQYPELFTGFATYGGDVAYEAFPLWFADVQRNETNGFRYSFPMYGMTYMLGAYAVNFTPDPSSPWLGEFPLKEGTGEVIDSVYAKWMKFSPSTYGREYYASNPAPDRSLAVHLSSGTTNPWFGFPTYTPKFTEYFHDSLSAWNVTHEYDAKSFDYLTIVTWASKNFAPLPKFDHDMAIRKPDILTVKTTGFGKWQPTVAIRNHGKADANNVKVFCEIKDEAALLYSAQTEIASIKTLDIADVRFVETWTPLLHKNYSIKFYVQNTGEENAENDSLTMTLGSIPLIDDFEGSLDKWQRQPGWNLSQYKPNKGSVQHLLFAPPALGAIDSWLELKTPFDLAQARSARFTFNTRFDLAMTDSGMVQVSSDDGATWMTVGSLCCDGEQAWLKYSFSLDSYVGNGFDNVRIRIRFVSQGGNDNASWEIDNATLEVNSLTEITAPATTPASCVLFDNYPNPFNASTTLAYQIQQPAHVTLTVYNAIGQHVITLVDARQESGRYTIVWDGTNQNGQPTTSGLYVYSLKAGDFLQQKKLVLLK